MKNIDSCSQREINFTDEYLTPLIPKFANWEDGGVGGVFSSPVKCLSLYFQTNDPSPPKWLLQDLLLVEWL